MSRPMLLVSVALASYAILSTLASVAVTVAWRARLLDWRRASSARRARRLMTIRAFPATVAAVLTAGLVVPGFVAFEPVRPYEATGPVFVMVAGAAFLLFAAALAVALSTAIMTRRLERAWMRSAAVLDLDTCAGVPAYAIDSPAPVVALVGVFSPKLVAARNVIEACSHDELASIIAHERGHVTARDNLKRWLMACAPDLLRWTSVHHEIVSAWSNAAEDAADDAATAGMEAARVNLAALLVKVARLTPSDPWARAMISPFVEEDGLDRRVRRLLAAEPQSTSSRSSVVLPLTIAGVAAILLANFSSPAVQERVHALVEAVVAFGR